MASEVLEAAAAMTTAASGSSFFCYAAVDVAATTTADADAVDVVTTVDAANLSNAVTCRLCLQ